jgi:hypothetical protein
MPKILDKPVPRDVLIREIEALGQRRLPSSGTFSISGDRPAARQKTK